MRNARERLGSFLSAPEPDAKAETPPPPQLSATADDDASLSLTSSAMAKKQGQANLLAPPNLTETAKTLEEEEREAKETLGEATAVVMAEEEENVDRINIVNQK